MIDIAGNNTCIIFNESSSCGARRQQQHDTFLKNAGYHLIGPHVQQRLENGFLNPTILQAMKNIGYEPTRTLPSAERLQQSRRCVYCSLGHGTEKRFSSVQSANRPDAQNTSPLCASVVVTIEFFVFRVHRPFQITVGYTYSTVQKF